MKDIKTKPLMKKPKMLEKSITIPREAKNILKEQYQKQKAEAQNRYNQNSIENNPNNYATEEVEGAATAATNDVYLAATKARQYTYKKYREQKNKKIEKHFPINSQTQIAQQSQPTSEIYEFHSNNRRIKTKKYKVKDTLRFKTKFTKSSAKKMAHQKLQKKLAQETAKHTVQAAKATAKATAKVTVKVTQLVATAVKALVSAIIAMGGWAVLLVVLIIVIVVAAVAASPFGIFISEEANEGIPVSAIVAECNQEFTQKIEAIESSNTYDREELQGEQADWAHVLAVFSVKTAGTDEDTAQDVVVIDETKKLLLKEVFWNMNPISSNIGQKNGGTVLYITIGGKTSNDMITRYNFSSKQQEALITLLENSDVLLSATHSLAISDAAIIDVLNKLPKTLSPERKAVVKAACSLVGKVNYFWGGKSSAIGWDSNWGKMMRVTADGSSSTGTIRPFGLDCSGFVTWAFINAGISGVGNGTQSQNTNSTHIDWKNAQPGDLAFYSNLSHVGIVVGKDASGNVLVIHCNSSANNVSLTINSGFGFCARPSAFY